MVVQATSHSFQTVEQAEAQFQHQASSHALMVRLDNLDQHYSHVKKSGARIVQPPSDFPYGERQYTVKDLVGRHWTFSQSIADVDPGSWGGILRERATPSAE